jgi:hypothetical protein
MMLAVYAGRGSSHSWTWLADLFESTGIQNVRFLDSDGFVKRVSHGCDIALLSGGDGFSIASALSGLGFTRLKHFIESGGRYVGICAGAYLPLPSSLRPFSEFNLSSTKIENINCTITPLENIPPRVAVSYGRCAVVHPVRGEVELDWRGGRLKAPIYGGPIFREPDKDEVLLRYFRFTPNTEFQFVRDFAKDIVLGRPAAIRCYHGEGELLLFGPHLEHPSYPEANSIFLELLGLKRSEAVRVRQRKTDPGLAKVLADLKVAILGLENRSFIVGRKLWDGSRYLELQKAIEKRAWSMGPDLVERVSSALASVRERIMQMSIGIETDADETTGALVDAARECVDNHFQVLVSDR